MLRDDPAGAHFDPRTVDLRFSLSGARTSMYDLALLHAAARARRVFIRDGDLRMLERTPGEDAVSFLRRPGDACWATLTRSTR